MCVSCAFVEVCFVWGGGKEMGDGRVRYDGNRKRIPTHDVKIDGMIDEIILARFDAFGGTEIDAVGSTHVFDLLPGARQADKGGVEFREVFFEDGGGVAGRVAGYE